MRAAALVLAALLSAGGTARADDDADKAYDDALAAIDAVRLDEAAKLLDRAWQAGHNEPARVREILLAAGDVAATIDDRAAAARWFSLLAAIDPSAELPAGTSPKVTEIYQAARSDLAGRHIGATLVLSQKGSELHIQVDDPLGVITAVRARVDAGRGRRLAIDPARHDAVIQVDISPGATVSAELTLLDAQANALVVETVTVTAPVEEVVEQQAPPSPPAPRPWIARWKPWAAGASALAVTAGVLAFISLDARSELDALGDESGQHEATEALAVERRMQRTAIAAQIVGGVALAAGVTSFLLWRSERETRIAPIAGEGAAGLAIEGSF